MGTAAAFPAPIGRPPSEGIPAEERIELLPLPPIVRFYGEVSAERCAALVVQLDAVDAACEPNQPIHLHIQSLGGELMPMMHVLDRIDALTRPLYTHVDGYAASAASLLSVYGDRRFMTKRSFVLIHELRTATQGPYSSLVADAAHSRDLMRMMVDVYSAKTNMNRRDIERLMAHDTWLDARQCLRRGIVDEIGPV